MINKKIILIYLINVVLAALFPWRWLRRRSLKGLLPDSVLFCRVDHIGDVYLSLPALASVRAAYPNAKLVVLAPSWAESLFRVAGYHDELLICDPPWWVSRRKMRFGGSDRQKSWLALWQTIVKIRRYSFDLCIEMRGDVRQILAFGVLGGATRLLTRSRNGAAFLADYAPTIDESLHECQQNLDLIKALGITDKPPVFPKPYSEMDIESANRQLLNLSSDKDEMTVLIHPGAKWVNQWPAQYYSKLIAELGAEFPEFRVLLTGAESESALCEQIATSLPERAISLAGRLTLTETAALMASVNLILMADTGPMHFLNAVRTPAILLFGPTSPTRFCPYGNHIQVIAMGDCCIENLHEVCHRVAKGEPSDCMARIDYVKVISFVRETMRKAKR
ncbi:MAG: glycosyltransferase family 9 protein [Gammaproteobacteria bacterium]